MASFEDFQKLEIRIGKVISAEKVTDADKLLKLEVDFGPSTGSGQVIAEQNKDENSAEQAQSLEENPSTSSGSMIRQIVSGIAEFYKPEDLIGKEFPFLFNLEPRTIRGVESQGMILAVDDGSQIALLNPDKEIPPGSKVR